MDCIEKIDARINVEEILRSIENLCTRYPSYQRSEAVGGWSVQSIYGSYAEGWPKVFCPYNGLNNMAPTWNPLNEYEKSLGSFQDFVNPTEFYSEPLWGLIKKIDAMGFNPRRARVKSSYRQELHQFGTSTDQKNITRLDCICHF